jgi:hypothetical protein
MKKRSLGTLLACLVILAIPAAGREEMPAGPQFKYRGGTENLPQGCVGSLELASQALTFRCPSGSIAVPYASIQLMQYRPDLSRQVRNMKLKWQVKPDAVKPLIGGRRNRYFTVVYGPQGTRAMVLDVSPETMRPYLAEIDLKAGKRVEVMEVQEYE